MRWHLTSESYRSPYEGQAFHSPMDEGSSNIEDLIQKLDSENMIGCTESFVSDIEKGFSVVHEEHLPWLTNLKSREWAGVLCLGMGGSAAGGDFLGDQGI